MSHATDSYHQEQADYAERITRQRVELRRREWQIQLFWRAVLVAIAMLVVGILLALSGCTDLQRDYYESVEEYRLTLEAGIRAGRIEVDAVGRSTLDDWAETQRSALKALEAGGE